LQLGIQFPRRVYIARGTEIPLEVALELKHNFFPGRYGICGHRCAGEQQLERNLEGNDP